MKKYRLAQLDEIYICSALFQSLAPAGAAHGPSAASENFFDLIRLNSSIEGWIRRPTAHGRRIHRITNHI